MLNPSNIDFLIRSLGLQQIDVAKRLNTTAQNISAICRGKHKPSAELLIGIEAYIKEVHYARNGETTPPEVRQIVMDLLYPRNPFDPTPGRSSSRSKLGKNQGILDASIIPPSAPSETAAHASKNALPALPATTHDTRREDADRATNDATDTGAENRDRAAGGQPVGALGSLPDAGARSADCSATRVLAGAILTNGRFWRISDLQDKRSAARIAARIAALKGRDGVRAIGQKFYDDVRAEHPGWIKDSTTNTAIRKLLARVNTSVICRERARDPELAERRAKVAAFALTYVAPIEQHSHSKGAYQDRAWMDLRATLLGYWDTPAFQEKIFELYGTRITFRTFETIFRQEFGGLSPAERAMDRYVRACIGDAPEYAGQYLQLDGTEIPINVLDGWGRSRRDGELHYPAVGLIDVGTLRTWLHAEGNTSEVYLWSPLLVKYFEQEEAAPEKILTDLGGRLFHTLRGQQPGEPVMLEPGLGLALAVGVQPANHTAENARAKGTVEAGFSKAGKSEMKRLLVGRVAKALFSELAKVPLDKRHIDYRQLDSEQEWRAILAAWEVSLNARFVKRVGDGHYTREEAYRLPQFAERRRKLAANWKEAWRETVSRGFAMEVRTGASGNMLHYKGARAELRTVLGRKLDGESVAILYPGGLRAGDEQYDGDLLRGVIVEPRPQGGMPAYHAIEALKIKKSFLGFDLDRPKVNEQPKAKPETEHELRRRAWADAGKALPAAVRQAQQQVREATNDTIVL